MLKGALHNRYFRRLFFFLTGLVILDFFIPSIATRLEKNFYENIKLMRFEESDTFPLKSYIQYFKENPDQKKDSVLFLGNSFVWGYREKVHNSLPYLYGLRNPDLKIYNLSYNSQPVLDSYLIAREIGSSFETLILFAPKLLALGFKETLRLSPDILGEDSIIYLKEKNVLNDSNIPSNHFFTSLVNMWNLKKYSERIQTALWNSSAQVYFYHNKKDIISNFMRLIKNNKNSVPNRQENPIDLSVKSAGRENFVETQILKFKKDLSEILKLRTENKCTSLPDSLLIRYDSLLRFFAIPKLKKTSIIIFDYYYDDLIIDENDRLLINCHIYPNGFIFKIPRANRELTNDKMHFNSEGVQIFSFLISEAISSLKKSIKDGR